MLAQLAPISKSKLPWRSSPECLAHSLPEETRNYVASGCHHILFGQALLEGPGVCWGQPASDSAHSTDAIALISALSVSEISPQSLRDLYHCVPIFSLSVCVCVHVTRPLCGGGVWGDACADLNSTAVCWRLDCFSGCCLVPSQKPVSLIERCSAHTPYSPFILQLENFAGYPQK